MITTNKAFTRLLESSALQPLKPASKEPSEGDQAKRRLLLHTSAAGLMGGGAWALGNAAKPHLTGRTTLYHGTDATGMSAINKRGLLPAARSKRTGITNMLDIKKGNDYVYLARHKNQARVYSRQADILPRGNVTPEKITGFVMGRGVLPNAVNPGNVAKYNVPLHRPGIQKRLSRNPELDTLFGQFGSGLIGDKNVVTFKGKMPNAFKVGHPSYKPLGVKEWKKYAKDNPHSVAKGAAMGLGAAALGYGAYRVAKNAHNQYKKTEDTRSNPNKIGRKALSTYGGLLAGGGIGATAGHILGRKKSPYGAVAGGLIGTGLGALAGYKYASKPENTYKQRSKKERLFRSAVGGLAGYQLGGGQSFDNTGHVLYRGLPIAGALYGALS